MRTFPLFPLLALLVILALPHAPSAAQELTNAAVVDRWRIDGIVNEKTGKASPGAGATFEFLPDGRFKDGRDGSSGTWSLRGETLELSYSGGEPRKLTGGASLAADGRLVWSCHPEADGAAGRETRDDTLRITLVARPDEDVEDGGAGIGQEKEPVAGDPVAARFPQGAWVDGTGVNLRASSGKDSRSLGKLRQGEGLEVVAEGPAETLGELGRHPWWKVKVTRTGKTGWVFGAFVKPAEGCSN